MRSLDLNRDYNLLPTPELLI
ncbi:hypothetical protein CY0110_16122 [Crocosphaera chwakensis CCY0110]|uniref:Uncharacterized protein n=1 Tax=Crocosphaera chwakensis CCY0110 TaxID=391612 RepID=A3IHQ6_9CHRO|nr:hypothetical protein CY0110_16122 [Crocosphaera chwakensis CCY0110]